LPSPLCRRSRRSLQATLRSAPKRLSHPEESTMLSNALIFDPAALAIPPKKPLRLPGLSDGKGFDVKRTEKPGGSATVVVKQPLQTEWDNSVGADLKPATDSAFNQPLPSTGDSSGGGAAWASVGAPNVASVDARIDPSNEQGKVGTTLKQSIPFGGRFAVTLQDTYSVTETLGQPSAGPDDLPLMALPPARRRRRCSAMKGRSNSTSCRPAPRSAQGSRPPAMTGLPTTT
jgi:hypothetical protein